MSNLNRKIDLKSLNYFDVRCMFERLPISRPSARRRDQQRDHFRLGSTKAYSRENEFRIVEKCEIQILDFPQLESLSL